jgi:hypothetical protein
MAGLINLRLLTDFFNKIGPKRRLLQRSDMSEIGGGAEVAAAP